MTYKRMLPPGIPEGQTDLFIDTIYNRIVSISGGTDGDIITIELFKMPVYETKQTHKFVLKSYRNETKLREFLTRTIEFSGKIKKIEQFHDSHVYVYVKIKNVRTTL